MPHNQVRFAPACEVSSFAQQHQHPSLDESTDASFLITGHAAFIDETERDQSLLTLSHKLEMQVRTAPLG